MGKKGKGRGKGRGTTTQHEEPVVGQQERRLPIGMQKAETTQATCSRAEGNKRRVSEQEAQCSKDLQKLEITPHSGTERNIEGANFNKQERRLPIGMQSPESTQAAYSGVERNRKGDSIYKQEKRFPMGLQDSQTMLGTCSRPQGNKKEMPEGNKEKRLPVGLQRPGSSQAEYSSDIQMHIGPAASNSQQIPKGRGRGRGPLTISPSQMLQSNLFRYPEHGLNHSQASTSTKAIASTTTADKILCKVSPLPSNVDASKFAVRPGRGVKGTPIPLYANYFVMKHKNTNIFHYDVEINSLDQKKKGHTTNAAAIKAGLSHIEHQMNKSVGKAKCQEVIAQMIQSKALQDYNPVYDGSKNIYTSTPLPITYKQSVIVSLKMAGKIREYEVLIQPVEKDDGSNMISLKPLQDMQAGICDVNNIPQEILMALNTIMNHRELSSNQIQVGRSFFFLNQTENIGLGNGIEIWFGYNQSIHFTEKGPALVLNLSAKAVHKAGPVIQYANDILRNDITRLRSLTALQITKLNNALRGLKVEVTHLPYRRKYAIQGVSRSSADTLKLDIDGIKITVAQYFKEKYKPLKFPHLPCLHMRSNNNQTYVPFENCDVCAGQPKLGKLNPLATRKMIKETAIPATERFKSITSYAETVRKESGTQMNNFSLYMDLHPLKVMGRVLEPPLLAYFDEVRSVIRPDIKGTWRMEGKHLYRTKQAKSWILISFVDEKMCSRRILENFAKLLCTTGRKIGLDFGKLHEIKIFSQDVKMWDALMYAKESQATFVIAVLSKEEDNFSYEELKFICDYHLGIVTQCMDENVIKRFTEQIASNVCLKLNAKLGGVNHILSSKPEIFVKPIIIFGADAVHSPRGSGCPSIAAVVGSLDAYPSKYKLTCRVQDNPDGNKISQERILELRDMVESILKAFNQATRKHPEKIIFFRDGVSEGQFGTILENEVTNIQEACLSVIGGIVPITFIIVQKRHQTRFRPQDPKMGVGRMGNMPPGTTVDTDVTHPRYFDFFLCSHEGIQGTSKPAKYTVLHDDNNFQADEIQKLSYHLCHMYVRCNRSISIPAPVMYADLAAYRAKKYADWHIQKAPDNSSNSSDAGSRLPEHVRDAINNMDSFVNNMFFV